ncbi:hypothetical protein NDU88_005179 [Pleurodeles waltl]|uniref:Uncharacterized protein n=1 Tax=Pleurodeles waltl TaxID=8319 RepID=A0AAV7L1L1_PLEWA|nr:hypothetical protein NDU88_005179 [Pleurodeles waltl]
MNLRRTHTPLSAPAEGQEEARLVSPPEEARLVSPSMRAAVRSQPLPHPSRQCYSPYCGFSRCGLEERRGHPDVCGLNQSGIGSFQLVTFYFM